MDELLFAEYAFDRVRFFPFSKFANYRPYVSKNLPIADFVVLDKLNFLFFDGSHIITIVLLKQANSLLMESNLIAIKKVS
jgi:hypothetical protein